MRSSLSSLLASALLIVGVPVACSSAGEGTLVLAVDAEAGALPDFSVEWSPEFPRGASTVRQGNTYTWRGLPADQYTLTVSAPGFEPRTIEVNVAPDAVLDESVTLAPSG